MIQPGSIALGATVAAGSGNAATNKTKLKAAAKQFEAMFLGEMLQLARPPDQAAGPFSAGTGEKTWESFMNQALGQAMAANGGLGLTKEIEDAMQKSQASGATETE